jgi:hypothetical protein
MLNLIYVKLPLGFKMLICDTILKLGKSEENKKNPDQDSRSLGLHLKPGTPEHKVRPSSTSMVIILMWGM